MRTPRDITIYKKCDCEYCYFGIQKGIERILLQNRYEYSNILKLVFNIDDLPLFKSAGIQLWPILGYFDSFDIFIIAIYGGESKPNSFSEYLKDFMNELNHLIWNGFNFYEKYFNIDVKCFFCDAPARSFLKGIISHTGYNSSERCCVPGTYEGRVFFNDETEYPKRNKETFKQSEYRFTID